MTSFKICMRCGPRGISSLHMSWSPITILCNSSIPLTLVSLELGLYNIPLCSNNPLLFRLRFDLIWFVSFYVVFSFRFWYSLSKFSTFRILYSKYDSQLMLAYRRFAWWLKASPNLFSFPFICFIYKSYSLRNGNHLDCRALRLCWSTKYFKLILSDISKNIIPMRSGCHIFSTCMMEASSRSWVV